MGRHTLRFDDCAASPQNLFECHVSQFPTNSTFRLRIQQRYDQRESMDGGGEAEKRSRTRLKVMQHRQRNRELRHFFGLQRFKSAIAERALARVIRNAAAAAVTLRVTRMLQKRYLLKSVAARVPMQPLRAAHPELDAQVKGDARYHHNRVAAQRRVMFFSPQIS